MADEPENLTLHLLREMREENSAFRTEVRERFDRLEQRFDGLEQRVDRLERRVDGLEQHVVRLETETRSQSETLGKVIEAVTKIAKVQEQHSELLAGIVRVQKSHGGRLNIIDERLADLERRAGFVSA